MGAKTARDFGCELSRIQQRHVEHVAFLGFAAAYRDANPEESWPQTVRAFKMRLGIRGGLSEKYLINHTAETFFEFTEQF